MKKITYDTKEQYQQRINKQIDKQFREKQKSELDAEIQSLIEAHSQVQNAPYKNEIEIEEDDSYQDDPVWIDV